MTGIYKTFTAWLAMMAGEVYQTGSTMAAKAPREKNLFIGAAVGEYILLNAFLFYYTFSIPIESNTLQSSLLGLLLILQTSLIQLQYSFISLNSNRT